MVRYAPNKDSTSAASRKNSIPSNTKTQISLNLQGDSLQVSADGFTQKGNHCG